MCRGFEIVIQLDINKQLFARYICTVTWRPEKMLPRGCMHWSTAVTKKTRMPHAKKAGSLLGRSHGCLLRNKVWPCMSCIWGLLHRHVNVTPYLLLSRHNYCRIRVHGSGCIFASVSLQLTSPNYIKRQWNKSTLFNSLFFFPRKKKQMRAGQRTPAPSNL